MKGGGLEGKELGLDVGTDVGRDEEWVKRIK